MPRKKSDKAKSTAKKTARTEPDTEMPYDVTDEKSVLQYAARLTGKSLKDLIEHGERVEGGIHTKGYFGQIVEESYFLLPNNSSPLPDFQEIGIELKVTPMREKGKGYVSKERLVLGIINYNEVPKRGFDIFTDKDSHLLIVFYRWRKDTDVYSYKILKVVDWIPSDEEMRLIRDDWDVIEGYVMRGEAHHLSERHTKYLSACTKGAGHGKDMRTQPFSSELAKQRALSFKPSFMTSLYNTSIDVGSMTLDGIGSDSVSVIQGEWGETESFEEHVMTRYERFVGMTCREIEESLGIELNSDSKQYYHTLSLAMIGVTGKKHAMEFEKADIMVKTIRIRNTGSIKECMSFPYIRFDEMVEQTWDESTLYEILDHEFFSPVFSFTEKDTKQPRKNLVFDGAFFWSLSDDDFITAEKVWEDTKAKVLDRDFDHFVKASDDRVVHIRPHARNKEDKATYRGEKVRKVAFWLNSSYIKKMVDRNLKSHR